MDNILPTIEVLLQLYVDGDLDKNEKVFKYQRNNQTQWIHIDELKNEAVLRNCYPQSKHRDMFNGIITRQKSNDTSTKSNN